MKYQYRMAPNPTEFSVVTGLANAKLDFKTLAKDIPCQEACPAKTNVPHYIEQIFQGNHDAAYRINLEDNVFPGALGRICTRPCESACRHNWTGVQGPRRRSPPPGRACRSAGSSARSLYRDRSRPASAGCRARRESNPSRRRRRNRAVG